MHILILLLLCCYAHANSLFILNDNANTDATSLLRRSNIPDAVPDPAIRNGLKWLSKNLIVASEILDVSPFVNVMKSMLKVIRDSDENAKLIPERIRALENTSSPFNTLLCLPLGTTNRTQAVHRRTQFDATRIMAIPPQDLKPNPEEILFGKTKNIGSGAASTVYKAMWRNVPVAIKIFRTEHQENVREGMMEILLMHDLRHPNILQIYGAYATTQVEYFVMEYFETSLRNAMENKKFLLSWNARLRILAQIASSLSYMHSFKPPLVHGELRASNILLTRNKHARLADLGRSFGIPCKNRRGPPVMWTAPEMFNRSSEHYSLSAETYAFGILMYEVLTRQLPYQEYENLEKIEAAVIQGFRPEIPQFKDVPSMRGMPAGYVELMQSCWTQNPQLRPSMVEILSKLLGIQQKMTETQFGVI